MYCSSLSCSQFAKTRCQGCAEHFCESCLATFHNRCNNNRSSDLVAPREKKAKVVSFAEEEPTEKKTKVPETTRDPTAKSPRGWSLLCESVAASQVEEAKSLLLAKADVQATTAIREWTCLHVLAKFPPKSGLENTVAPLAQLLIEANANLVALDRDKETPADAAIQNDRTDVLQLLLTARVNPLTVSAKNGWSLLHQAVFFGSLKSIDFLLYSLATEQRDQLVSIVDPCSQTPLHFAAKLGNLEVCQKLLSVSAHARCTDNSGATPLHLASAAGASFELLDVLKADIETPDNEGNTPLAFASSPDIVRSLVRLRAGVNHTNHNGQTALSLAVSHGAVELVACLIELQAHAQAEDNDGNTPLHCAAELFSVNTRRIVQYLLDAHASCDRVNKAGETALEVAKRAEASSAVLQLLRDASAPPLFQLLQKGEVGPARTLLLTNPALLEQTFEGTTPFHQACKAQSNPEACVRLLLEVGKPTCADADGCTVLHLAAAEGLSQLIPLLTVAGVDLSAVDKHQQTALHKACEQGHELCVKELLEANIDPNVQDRNGYTPIELACRKGHTHLVELLNRMTPNPNNANLLRVAAAVCDPRAVSLALEAKCDVNTVYDEGNTALFYALQDSDEGSESDKEDEERVEVVRLLVAAKANVNIVNQNNISVLKYAKMRKHRTSYKIIGEASRNS